MTEEIPCWDYAELLKALAGLRHDITKLSFYVVKQETATSISDGLISETLNELSAKIEMEKKFLSKEQTE